MSTAKPIAIASQKIDRYRFAQPVLRSATLCYLSALALRSPPILYLALKAALSGIIVAAASEAARRAPALGALILSLPLVSLLAFVWLWQENGDAERVAAVAQSTFWYVLPTLPMFLVLPALLRAGVGFWLALLACCALTFALYLLTTWLLGKFGIAL